MSATQPSVTHISRAARRRVETYSDAVHALKHLRKLVEGIDCHERNPAVKLYEATIAALEMEIK